MKTTMLIEPLNNSKRKVLNGKLTDEKFRNAKKYIVSTMAGDGNSGLVDGPAPEARFKAPLDIVVLPGEKIFVADGFNSCIRKIENGQVTTFAGNGNANTVDGTGITARFKIPSRMTVDEKENLYILDAADPRIRKITPTAEVSTYAGAHHFGCSDGNADIARFGQSFGIVIDALGNIYVADSQNNRIRKISACRRVTTIAGSHAQGYQNGKSDVAQFFFMTGMTMDIEGNLFVSDINRIRKITSDGIVSTIAGSMVSGYVDGKKNAARFSQIESLAMDREGNIYVTDENRIRKISPQGIVTTIAGSTAGYQDGDATSAKFDGPQGLAVDKHGNIYVADLNNRRIRKISLQQTE